MLPSDWRRTGDAFLEHFTGAHWSFLASSSVSQLGEELSALTVARAGPCQLLSSDDKWPWVHNFPASQPKGRGQGLPVILEGAGPVGQMCTLLNLLGQDLANQGPGAGANLMQCDP